MRFLRGLSRSSTRPTISVATTSKAVNGVHESTRSSVTGGDQSSEMYCLSSEHAIGQLVLTLPLSLVVEQIEHSWIYRDGYAQLADSFKCTLAGLHGPDLGVG